MVGSRTLKAVSVLWTIFGVFSLIVNGYELASLLKMSLMIKSFVIPVVLGMIWAVLQVLAGLVGIKNWNRPEKANVCLIVAVLTMVACLSYNVFMMIYGFSLWPILSMLAGIVFIVIYLMGVNYNKKLNA
ncbi:MAG: hypothetical protein IJN10_09585 [Firmicutes bacterium]|nr:hypothetical protein [Bacillota bacterium]